MICVLGVVSRGGWGGLRPVTLCEVMICVAHSFLDHVQVNLSYLWLPLSREVIIVYSAATGQMSKRTLNERSLKAFCDGGHWLCFHFLSYAPRQEEREQKRPPALPSYGFSASAVPSLQKIPWGFLCSVFQLLSLMAFREKLPSLSSLKTG